MQNSKHTFKGLLAPAYFRNMLVSFRGPEYFSLMNSSVKPLEVRQLKKTFEHKPFD